MRKRLSVLVLFCLLIAIATGCSNEDTSQSGSRNSGTPVNLSATGKKVDVDLTVLSNTVAFAEATNIAKKPDKYLGKIIRMRGDYYSSYFDGTGLQYHYVVIEDASTCCRNGFEFIWNGVHIYPDDYPEEQTPIEVVGVYDSYDELGKKYYYLAVDAIGIVND